VHKQERFDFVFLLIRDDKFRMKKSVNLSVDLGVFVIHRWVSFFKVPGPTIKMSSIDRKSSLPRTVKISMVDEKRHDLYDAVLNPREKECPLRRLKSGLVITH